MIPLNPQQLPPQKSKWHEGGGQASTPAFYLMRSLFLRTGGNSGIPQTVGTAITASGANHATAQPIKDDFNQVTHGVGGVMLHPLKPGQFQVVANNMAGNLNVYPASQGQVDALAVEAPYVLAPGKSQLFWCVSLASTGGSMYQSLQLG